MWTQSTQVKTQMNYILLVIQMRDNGYLVNDAAVQHGGLQ